MPLRSARLVIPGAALAGSVALVVAAWEADGGAAVPIAAAAAALAMIGAVAWLTKPRLGAPLLSATAGVVVLVTVYALIFGGATPSSLLAFWGAAALSLAAIAQGFLGEEELDRTALATALAVAVLLVTSGAGLALYVRSQWTAGEQEVLRDLPVYESSGYPVVYEPAPGGEWAAYWQLEDAPDWQTARDALRAALEADGWEVKVWDPDMMLAATRDGWTARFVLEGPVPRTGPTGPARVPESPVPDAMNAAAYVRRD